MIKLDGHGGSESDQYGSGEIGDEVGDGFGWGDGNRSGNGSGYCPYSYFVHSISAPGTTLYGNGSGNGDGEADGNGWSREDESPSER